MKNDSITPPSPQSYRRSLDDDIDQAYEIPPHGAFHYTVEPDGSITPLGLAHDSTAHGPVEYMNGALQTLQILSDRKTMEILSDHQTREILAERDKKMERNARLINQTGKYAFALSLGASLFAAPLVFGTIAVTSIIIGALNRKATDQGHYNTEMAFNAVNICTDPTRNLEDKKAAFALLEKTNNHIRQWEEINAIAGTIIKTGAKEVASRLGGGLAADVTDEVIKKYTAKEKTSVKMDRALEAFKEEIGLSQPSELKRDKLPSADFHIN